MQKVPRRQPDVCPPQVDAACVCGCSWRLGMLGLRVYTIMNSYTPLLGPAGAMPMVKLPAICREISRVHYSSTRVLVYYCYTSS